MNERIEEGLKGMDLKNQILQQQQKKKKVVSGLEEILQIGLFEKIQ